MYGSNLNGGLICKTCLSTCATCDNGVECKTCPSTN